MKKTTTKSPTTRRLTLLIACTLTVLSAFAGDGKRADDPNLETATFSMYCYWTGEATLGRVDGVVASRIGHWSGKEIVQVDYDPTRTNADELTRALKRQNSFYSLLLSDEETHTAADGPVTGGKLKKGEITVLDGNPHFIAPKHSLRTRHPRIAALDLSESQAIALNSWSYFGGSMPDVLTEDQKRQLEDR